MANVTDVLETVFKITGGAQLAATLGQIAGAAQVLSGAMQAATAGTLIFSAALLPVLLAVGAVIAAVTVLKATFDLATTALKAFAEESKQLFATGVVLKNLGSSLTLPAVRAFAERTSEDTGISRPEIEGTAGRLARTGVGGDQIQRMLRSIGDTARGTTRSFDEVGEAVEKGILGHMRGLAEFGIILHDTGSKAANAALIMQQLNIRFEGAAQAFRETLPGAMENLQSSMQRFLSNLGEQFAPAAIRVFNTLANVLDFLATHAQAVANAMALLFGGPLGLLLLKMAQGADAGKDPMAKVGHGGDLATEATLGQVADNTKQMADAVTQQVLGGSGEIVNQAFNFMHARIAMAV